MKGLEYFNTLKIDLSKVRECDEGKGEKAYIVVRELNTQEYFDFQSKLVPLNKTVQTAKDKNFDKENTKKVNELLIANAQMLAIVEEFVEKTVTETFVTGSTEKDNAKVAHVLMLDLATASEVLKAIVPFFVHQ
jgi:hypothetical protein